MASRSGRSFNKPVGTPDQKGKAGKNGERCNQHVVGSQVDVGVFDGNRNGRTITQNYLSASGNSGSLETGQGHRCGHEQATKNPVHLPLARRGGHEPEQLAGENGIAYHHQDIDKDQRGPHGGQLRAVGRARHQKLREQGNQEDGGLRVGEVYQSSVPELLSWTERGEVRP